VLNTFCPKPQDPTLGGEGWPSWWGSDPSPGSTEAIVKLVLEFSETQWKCPLLGHVWVCTTANWRGKWIRRNSTAWRSSIAIVGWFEVKRMKTNSSSHLLTPFLILDAWAKCLTDRSLIYTQDNSIWWELTFQCYWRINHHPRSQTILLRPHRPQDQTQRPSQSKHP
jgi:hypothetical protein